MFNLLLTTARHNLGLSQEQMAHKLRVSTRTVSRWERNAVKPSVSAVSVFAAYINRSSQGYMIAFPASVSREYKRLRIKAAQRVNREVKTNLRPRADSLTCVDCDGRAWVYDHRDYLKEFDIEPVCHACNSHRGTAINTFLAHEDYWKSFDWTEPPAQTQHPQFSKTHDFGSQAVKGR